MSTPVDFGTNEKKPQPNFKHFCFRTFCNYSIFIIICIARQVACSFQYVTCHLCNLSCNIFGLTTIAKSTCRSSSFYFLQQLHVGVLIC